MRIFLIEDNPVQIEWAKEQLADYELIVANCVRRGYEILEEADADDLIICDLELPWRPQDDKEADKFDVKPSMDNGFHFFKSFVLPLLINKAVKGIALLSDFEHHAAASEDGDTFRHFEKAIEIIGSVGKDVDWKPGSAFGLNLACIVDRSAGSYDEPVFYIDGEKLTNEEVYTRFHKRGDEINEFLKRWRAQGGVILKPYREAVEKLLAE